MKARGIATPDLPAANRKAVEAAVGAIERQATALCRGAAAASAWGRDAVRSGQYRPPVDDPCLRDAVAGQVIPLLGYLRGN